MLGLALAVPQDPYAGKTQAAATLKEAAEASVAAEERNVAMYDQLLAQAKGPLDLERVFAGPSGQLGQLAHDRSDSGPRSSCRIWRRQMESRHRAFLKSSRASAARDAAGDTVRARALSSARRLQSSLGTGQVRAAVVSAEAEAQAAALAGKLWLSIAPPEAFP